MPRAISGTSIQTSILTIAISPLTRHSDDPRFQSEKLLPFASQAAVATSLPAIPLQACLDPDVLLIDLRLNEPCQVPQRLLPAEITSLGWNGVRDACLHDIQLGADRHSLQRHRHLHLAGQIG